MAGRGQKNNSLPQRLDNSICNRIDLRRSSKENSTLKDQTRESLEARLQCRPSKALKTTQGNTTGHGTRQEQQMNRAGKVPLETTAGGAE